MDLSIRDFGSDEQIALKLRALFERRGFRRVRVNRFEDYALYTENKSFLESESIVTFMDMNGRLLALKPDVTLSVVRGMPQRPMREFEKLYYIDEVVRFSRDTREYKTRSQIGVELVGEADAFSSIEVVDLAIESLSLVGRDFVLDISHLGFVSGLLDALCLEQEEQKRALAAIHKKSAHETAAALMLAPAEHKEKLLALCGIHGPIESELPKARGLILSDAMRRAYAELEQLADVLRATGNSQNVNLDFSVVNDLDYYNGLIFLGYVAGVPKVVLSGGRYDNLMRRLGKQNGAIGFAVSLDELGQYLKSGREWDFDVLVTYPDDCDIAALLLAARELGEQGLSVRLEREGCAAAGLRCREHRRFIGNRLEKGGASC